MRNRINPDCGAGKHDACNRDAWDMVNDTACSCACSCHTAADPGYSIPVDPADFTICEACQ